MATPTTDDLSRIFPSPGRAPRPPASPPVGLPDSPIGPYGKTTGCDISDLPAWQALRRKSSGARRPNGCGTPTTFVGAIATARANLDAVRIAAEEAEAAMAALGPFDTKSAEA